MSAGATLVAKLATLGFACVVMIAAASAFLRVHGYGESAVPEGVIDAIRGTHRVAAILAGLAIIALAVIAFERRHARTDLAITAALLALTIVLAWIGRASAGTPHPAVAVTNLLGGFALAGLLWWLRVRQSGARVSSRVELAALAVIVVQLALGAALSITRVGVPILIAHGLLGLAFAAICWRLHAKLLLGLASAQIVLGAAMAFTQLPFALVYSHNLLAVLLFTATIHAMHRPPSA
ncbi:MAG: hypothetical protein HY017_10780 [Betaproteobacteria bacterium]|nr:hypothetical protein [Betaproteobacteria bacterium]